MHIQLRDMYIKSIVVLYTYVDQLRPNNKRYTHAVMQLKLINFVICDMIKGNESDVADIVFEILAKKELKFFLFYVVFTVDKLLKLCN